MLILLVFMSVTDGHCPPESAMLVLYPDVTPESDNGKAYREECRDGAS